MSDAIVVDKSAGAAKPKWWERINGVAMAVKRTIVAIFAPKPLQGRAFYVAARVVAATAGSLAAVVVWSTLVVGAQFGLLTLTLAFAIMLGLLVVAAKRITAEPATPQSSLI